MTKVLCKNCDNYDPAIHSCGRIDRMAGASVSYVFDDSWCFTEDGAKPMTDEEFKRKWWGDG